MTNEQLADALIAASIDRSEAESADPRGARQEAREEKQARNAIIARLDQRDELLAAAKDALSGWQYIRAHHGDLYGVGWDRVEQSLSAAIARAEGRTP